MFDCLYENLILERDKLIEEYPKTHEEERIRVLARLMAIDEDMEVMGYGEKRNVVDTH